ncbi:MAG: hypothetical protein ACKO96_31520, partial [Flammeovirgaceae bacterium]
KLIRRCAKENSEVCRILLSITGSILEKSHISAFIAIRDSLLEATSKIITDATPKRSSIIAISPGVKLASIGTIY